MECERPFLPLERPISSPADKREYAALKLGNGLNVILIHDRDIGKSAKDQDGACHGNFSVPPEASQEAAKEQKHVLHSDDDEVRHLSQSEDETCSSEEEESEHVRLHHPPRASRSADPVKKSAAAMSIGVGYFSDPDILPGLSHYLEHMLFMGSQKYPDENEYDAFLSAHSGSSNACTEEETTTFHFDCASDALIGGLERFAQFFICPLIKEDGLEREAKAVDSEFSGVLQSDRCRLGQLRAETCRQDHPSSKFGWGNRLSLVERPLELGINVRGKLVQHFEDNYSAERMNLVVIGGEPLPILQEKIIDLFGKIPTGKGPRPSFKHVGMPFEFGFGLGSLHVMPAVKDDHILHITFQLPCLNDFYKEKIDDYLSHLLGHEGRGSLLAYLKSRGWATHLCAGVIDQTSAAYLFEITITLTEAGLQADIGCGLAVVRAVFQYISMLKSLGPQKWVWDELASIARMKWQFLEEEDAADFVSQVAADMFIYPIEHVLAGGFLHEKFDPQKINEMLDMMGPEQARLDLQTHDYSQCREVMGALVESGNGMPTEKEEPWFKFPYSQVEIPKHLIDLWRNDAWPNTLHLPSRNLYLPADFSLRCDSVDGTGDNGSAQNKRNDSAQGAFRRTDTTKQDIFKNYPRSRDSLLAEKNFFDAVPPRIIVNDPGLRVWYKMDHDHRVPRTAAYFRLTCPELYSSPKNAAETHFLIKLLEDALCEEAYLAEVAELHYAVWFEGSSGVDVKVDGFSDKLQLMVKLIFQKLADLEIKEGSFNRIKETLIRTYRNANMKPLKQSAFLRLRLLKSDLFDLDQVLSEIRSLTIEGLRNAFVNLFHKSSLHISALILGNATVEEAKAMGECVKSALGATGSVTAGDRITRIPQGGSLLIRSKSINPDEDNSVVEIYFQFGSGVKNPRARAIVDLIDQITQEPCYDVLRTKEQLGYTVLSGHRYTHGVVGFVIILQSEAHRPTYLDARIDAFLQDFAAKLESMSDTEFEQNKASLVADKMMKDHSLIEEADRAWDALVNRGADFLSRQKEVAALRTIEKSDILEFFNREIAPAGLARRKLAVHIAGRSHTNDIESETSAAGSVTEIVSDIDSFKSRLDLFAPIDQQ